MSLKQKKLFKYVSSQMSKMEEEERKKLDNDLEQMLKKQQELNNALLASVFDGKPPEERDGKQVITAEMLNLAGYLTFAQLAKRSLLIEFKSYSCMTYSKFSEIFFYR